MVAPSSQLRPLTFFGRVPKDVNNVDICKELVKRFLLNELKCVQDFGASRYEVSFANMAAVERFLAKPVVNVGNQEVRFEYRGMRTMNVRVLGYRDDCNDFGLPYEFSAYGKVLAFADKGIPGFESILSGVRRVKMEMARPFPNLLRVRDRIVQCEYDGISVVDAFCRGTMQPTVRLPSASVVACMVTCVVRQNANAAEDGTGAAVGREAPLTNAGDLPLPEEAPDGDKEETMAIEWTLARGGKRRERSRETSKERPAAASSGGPGDSDEGLPELKRAAATDSEEQSTSSTVKDNTGGRVG
ncbi:hypothetical protein MTO96_033270 [Rhipicephalus appendiculatus]